ncbi:cytochrome c family protein [Alphaproteobacteria bacterium]|nr:cytochrome c family protein [Alphaproteobacteria bacterium]
MSGLEVNKILASIILAILVVTVIGHLGDIIVDIEHHEMEETAYKIDVPESGEATPGVVPKEEFIETISLLLASASLEKGEKLFKKCSSCHNYNKGSANKVGPNLWNLVNRPKANIDGFAYSKALAEYGGEWGYEEIAEFLYKPKKYIKGTKMNFVGLKKVQDRANLVLFLRDQSENPVPLP